MYGGAPTDKISLNALRTNTASILQVPEFLSNALHGNLDPFGQYDNDTALDVALRSAGLLSIQNEDGEGRIALETMVSSGGRSFSTRQRQIATFARAILCCSKSLILVKGKFLIYTKIKSAQQVLSGPRKTRGEVRRSSERIFRRIFT